MLTGFILKRVVQLIPLLVLISMISFMIIQLPPGDYLTTYIDQLESSGMTVDQSMVDSLKKQYGLDSGPIQQYFIWIGNILTKGDLGRSFLWNKPVSEVLTSRLAMSMLISFLTLIFVWLLAIPIGIYSATHQYSFFDYLFSFFSFVGLALPGFLIALFVIYRIFVTTGQVYTGLYAQAFQTQAMSMAKFLNMLPRLGLAVFLIGLPSIASLSRTMRAMMLDELEKQYVTTARAKGMEKGKILFKYPIRMAINPMISTIGWTIPALISGEIIISIVLNMPTTGPMLQRALSTQDMYLAGSFLLIVGVLTVIGTLISDILLAIMDPRIRFGGVSD